MTVPGFVYAKQELVLMPVNAESRIKEIEAEILKTQKNKATEHHIGLLKAKIAKLRKASSSKSGGGHMSVKKEGDATVSMIGFPSVGKSSILNSLTNAKSKVAAYEFTTIDCIPGVIDYSGSIIQILDLPGIIEGASAGKGMGKAILSYARISDLLLLVTDAGHLEKLNAIVKELEDSSFRLNESEPRIEVKILERNGINITSTVQKVDEKFDRMVKDLLREFGIHNAKIVFNELFDTDRLIDRLSRNRKYVRCFVVINKSEELHGKDSGQIQLSGKSFKALYVSALTGKNMDVLKKEIWSHLGLMRIFTVKRNGEIDDKPMIMKQGCSVEALCASLHKDMIKFFRYAKIKGKSARFEGQKVGLEHVLMDGDIVTIYTK